MPNKLHNDRQRTPTTQLEEGLKRIHDLSRFLSSALDLDNALCLAVDEIAGSLGEPGADAGVALLDDRGSNLKVISVCGAASAYLSGQSIPLSDIDQVARRLLFDEHQLWMASDRGLAFFRQQGQFAHGGSQIFITLPLVVSGRTAGILFISSESRRSLSETELILLEASALIVAVIVDNAQLHTRVDATLCRLVDGFEAVNKMLSTTSIAPDLDIILADVASQAATALRAEQVGITVCDDTGQSATVLACYQTIEGNQRPPIGYKFNFDLRYLGGRSIQKGLPLVIGDASLLMDSPEHNFSLPWSARSFLIIPLIARGRVLGAIHFASISKPRPFSPEEVSLAQTIAGHLAAAMENARLYESVVRERGTLEAIVESMNEGLIVVDCQGLITFCNRAAGQLFSMPSEQFLGRTIAAWYDSLADRIVQPRDWRETLIPRLAQAGEGKFRITVQVPERREIEGTFFSIRSDGKKLGTGAVLRDVTP
ncbi:MAG: GAF domain-containing protein [Chloroflexi bacterium]|nr:GAF domain-containing protein [Chloroflexota bacterium]